MHTHPTSEQQAELPIPRPPFDFETAFRQIAEHEQQIEELAALAETRKKSYAGAKADLEDAQSELASMIRQLRRQLRESQDEPIHTGLECYTERMTGVPCAICAADRAQQPTLPDQEPAPTEQPAS